MRRCFGNLAGDFRHKSAVIMISILISTAILCMDVDNFNLESVNKECMLTFKTGMQAFSNWRIDLTES